MTEKNKQTTVVTDAEQSALGKLPLHSADDIKGYLRPGEGLERVTAKTLSLLAGHDPDGSIAKALKLNTVHLQEEIAEAAHLSQLETLTFNLYRRAMENRMERESDVFRALLKLNRFVQNSEDPALQRTFKDLGDWVAASHAGGGGGGSGAAGGGTPGGGATGTPTG